MQLREQQLVSTTCEFERAFHCRIISDNAVLPHYCRRLLIGGEPAPIFQSDWEIYYYQKHTRLNLLNGPMKANTPIESKQQIKTGKLTASRLLTTFAQPPAQ
jgi:hypothetical protein